MALIELYGSREINLDTEGVAGKRLFTCDWDETETVCPIIGDTWPGKDYLFVQNVRWKGIGADSTDGGYSRAYMTVNYSTRRITKPVESLDFSGEALEVTAGRTWYSDGAACSQRASVLYPEIEDTVEFTTPYINKGMIYNLIGHVNMFPFRFAAPECILFAGCRARTVYTNLDEMAWRVQYRFIFRSTSWNRIWREDTAAWDILVPNLYNTANLGLLLM